MSERETFYLYFYTFSTWVQHGQKKLNFFTICWSHICPRSTCYVYLNVFFLFFMLFFFFVIFILIF